MCLRKKNLSQVLPVRHAQPVVKVRLVTQAIPALPVVKVRLVAQAIPALPVTLVLLAMPENPVAIPSWLFRRQPQSKFTDRHSDYLIDM